MFEHKSEEIELPQYNEDLMDQKPKQKMMKQEIIKKNVLTAIIVVIGVLVLGVIIFIVIFLVLKKEEMEVIYQLFMNQI